MSGENADRKKLEVAVTKIARCFEELVRVVEKSKTLEPTDLMKAHVALTNVQGASFKRAELSLTIASAANGFSLDQEPATEAVFAAAASNKHLPSLAASLKPAINGAILPGERIFGQKRRRARKEDDGLLDDSPGADGAARDDDTEEAEFLDDEE